MRYSRGVKVTLPPMARLAGLAPAGCICELVAPGDAGEMARRDDMTAFAKEHALPCVSIVQMQEYIRVRLPLPPCPPQTLRQGLQLKSLRLALRYRLLSDSYHPSPARGHPCATSPAALSPASWPASPDLPLYSSGLTRLLALSTKQNKRTNVYKFVLLILPRYC